MTNESQSHSFCDCRFDSVFRVRGVIIFKRFNPAKFARHLGIGTYSLTSSQAENSVYWALKAGFRLIDTARIYGNEDGVGRGIQRAIDEGIVTRGEIFVTTKMWTSDYSNGESAMTHHCKGLGLITLT